MAIPEPASTQVFSPHLSLEWYGEGQLAAIIIDSVTQANIDLFLEIIANLQNNWTSPPVRIMIDLHNPHISFTPYLRQKLQDLMTEMSHHEGFYAFVLANSVITQSMQLLLVDIIRSSGNVGKVDVYFSREKAYEILMEQSEE